MLMSKEVIARVDTLRDSKLRYAIAANLTRIDERREKLKGYNPYALARYLDRGDEAAKYIEAGMSPQDAATKAGFCDAQLVRAIIEAAKGNTLRRGSNRYTAIRRADAVT